MGEQERDREQQLRQQTDDLGAPGLAAEIENALAEAGGG